LPEGIVIVAGALLECGTPNQGLQRICWGYQNIPVHGTRVRNPVMSRNTSISLGDRFDRFVAEQVRQGRYASASEVVRAGLRLLEDMEVRREALRKMLKDGESSGFVDYSFEGLMAELDQEDPSCRSSG
jgi:antitoxin ParD1/3/4